MILAASTRTRNQQDFKTRKFFLAQLFFTKSFPHQNLHPPSPPDLHQQTEDQEAEEESIANRAHWTRRIHSLCTTHRDVDAALRLLERLRLRGYRPDALNMSSIVHSLCDANRFAEAHQRLMFSIAYGCVPDERVCNVLIARLLDARTPFETRRLILCLMDVDSLFVPSLSNYNRLIVQFCGLSEPRLAHRVLIDMIKRGHCPNTVSYTALMGGYCRVGEVGVAHKLLDEMAERDVVPNSLTISVLLGGVLRAREIEQGHQLLNELWGRMKEDDDSNTNHAAFSNLVDILCREGMFHEVFKIAEEMPQEKSVSEDFAYSQMIDSLCIFGRHHGASRIVYIMRKRGLTPSLASYNSIVHGLSTHGGISGCMRAYQLFQEGIGFGYVPSEYTYKVLIEGLCLCQGLDSNKAKDLLTYMLSKKGADQTRIYNIYLRALCLNNNNPTELLNALVLMLQMRCQPDVITLNTILKAFCKAERIEEAMKLCGDYSI
ncbi:hypothetical protein Dimus_009927 [Dionaea muscipula]